VWPYCSSAAAPPPLQACTARRLLVGRSIIIITIINLIFHVVDIFFRDFALDCCSEAQRRFGKDVCRFVGLKLSLTFYIGE
jgi:hypothetical protein